MKILLTGSIGYNLMAPFYKQLKANLKDVTIAVNGLRRPGVNGLKDCDVSFFDEIIDVPKPSDTEVKGIVFSFQIFKFLNKKLLWDLFKKCLVLRFKKAYVKLYHYVFDVLLEQAYKNKFSEFSVIDILYLSPGNLSVLKYVKESQQVILSFLGSDLFLLTGLDFYETQLSAIKRADFITTHSPEMKQILLSKFGREFESKIRLVFYGCDENRLTMIDQLKNDIKFDNEFRKKHLIPDGKLIIQLGYSGNKEQNHIEVLKSFEADRKDLQESICFIIPTTYGDFDGQYAVELKEAIALSSFECIHITNYMSDKEALFLSVLIDVLINLRDADAFNASMLESIYAENFVIVGDWLPYGMLRRKGGVYREVSAFDEVPKVVFSILENNKLEQEKLINNRDVIIDYFSMSANINNWKSLFEECNRISLKNP